MYSGSVITVSYCNTVSQSLGTAELNCMQSSSAATVHAVSQALHARVLQGS